MHTDEYEISITREMNHCQQVVKKTREKLGQRQQQYGLAYPEAAKAAAEGRLDLNAKAGRWVPDFTCAEHPGGPIHPDDPNLTDHQKEHQP